MLRQVYLDDDRKFILYNGFADLSRIEIIDADINGMVETIQQYTQLTPQFSDVKVAVCLPFGLTGSLAQIHKVITEDNTHYDLQIYSSVIECAEYLHVDKDLLIARN